ncbi:hypothetical protein B0H14DRAFT_1138478 [Mycena olivaceomarginata]|nr:hypothetical protein B0H14DRAFT_1138478 [Mycena olivaceomarginata]
MTVNTLQILADTLKIPFMGAIMHTTQAISKNVEKVRKNKHDCVQLLESTQKLLSIVVILHIKSSTPAEMPPRVLHHIGRFTETLHKIHNFVEAQQDSNRVKYFFRQGEIGTLRKECEAGLQQAFGFFEIESAMLPNALDMQEEAYKRHQEVLDIIETLSETSSSEGESTISGPYSGSHCRHVITTNH